MEAKINIEEILKDKPQGTKLHDLLRNIDVYLDEVHITDIGSYIECTANNEVGSTMLFDYSKLGTEVSWIDGLQILLPSKEMRDWRKFAWKKGDILVGCSKTIVFDGFTDDTYTLFKGKYCLQEDHYSDKTTYIGEDKGLSTKSFHIPEQCIAQAYIKVIEKILGGKLNLETLEIEKAQTEFKDGDVITIMPHIGDKLIYLFKSEDDEKYYGHAFLDGNIAIVNEDSYCQKDFCTARLSTEEEQKQLFDGLAKKHVYWDCEHKEIIELKPKWTPKSFDRVITRNDADEVWTANIFSHMDSHGEYVTIACVGGYTQCLPYNEETAKLIGTTKDVEG